MALVIGNDRYDELESLSNAVNDAEDMAATLRILGFEVVKLVDSSREEMSSAIESFAAQSSGADVSLLFYAGHGVEIGGENYLLPVDIGGFQQGFRIDQAAIALSTALVALKGSKTQVILLDACRDNPFPPDLIEDAGSLGGWAVPPIDVLQGTLVAYGTAPGSFASDNASGDNGVFTQALLADIQVPGLEAAEIMRRVTRRVREATSDAQSPWLSASYVLPFYFIEPPAFAHEAATASVSAIELWATEGGEAYDRGDFEAALPLLRQAARAGHTQSQYLIATMYLTGREVPEDREEAADWFELASRAGHLEAQYFLGGMYSGGFGRERDDARAADLYDRAAQQGMAVAQFRLGVVYESGRGRPENVDEAVQWYQRSARQGHQDAAAAISRLARAGNPQARAAVRGM